MEVIIYSQDELLHILPKGRLDIANTPEFIRILLEKLSLKPSVCVIDMSEVEYLSSAALEALLVASKLAKKESTKYALVSLNPLVHDIFYTSGFDQFIKVYENIDEVPK